jgi:hypothetical protein
MYKAIWMQRPAPMPGVPPGLEYLTQLSSVHVEQKASLTEALTGWDTNNSYFMRNSNGQQFLFAYEGKF